MILNNNNETLVCWIWTITSEIPESELTHLKSLNLKYHIWIQDSTSFETPAIIEVPEVTAQADETQEYEDQSEMHENRLKTDNLLGEPERWSPVLFLAFQETVNLSSLSWLK